MHLRSKQPSYEQELRKRLEAIAMHACDQGIVACRKRMNSICEQAVRVCDGLQLSLETALAAAQPQDVSSAAQELRVASEQIARCNRALDEMLARA